MADVAHVEGTQRKPLLDTLAESQPELVEELVPKLLSLGEVQKVQLLSERVEPAMEAKGKNP